MTLILIANSLQAGIVKNKTYLLRTLSLVLLAGTMSGQTATKQALLMAMKVNGKQALAYQWKQRITVIRKGNPLDPMIEDLRFDATGQLQRTTLAKPEPKRMGPIRAKKAAEVKEDIQEVMRLARRYANPQQIGQTIQAGEIWEGQGAIRVQARSVILPADEMTMEVDRSTYLARRIDFKTQHEGSPVTIAINYGRLPNGPDMMMRMTVQIPKDDIVVSVESYDFVKLAGPTFP